VFDGVRPVGIGETLRRMIVKCVSKATGNDVQMAAGAFQTCAGVQSGIEAAIHAMARTFRNEECEAVILVDADNAFNRLNRKVALHNIRRSCLSLYQFLYNGYKAPAKLHLGDGPQYPFRRDSYSGRQYAIGTRNLISKLK
jgi:hypothetical protein